jgi:hypothetical protein
MPKDDAGGILKQQIKLPIWVDAKAENVTLSANSVTACAFHGIGHASPR